MLSSFPLSLLIWLYATHPGVEVLRISGPLFLNLSIAKELSIEYNPKTAVLRVRIENEMLGSWLLSLLIWLNSRKWGS